MRPSASETARSWNRTAKRLGFDPAKFYIDCPVKLSPAEKKAITDRARELDASYALVRPEGDVYAPELAIEYRGAFVDAETGKKTSRPFERIRRITGYLVGTLDRWNSAKQAEERDRVKHGVPVSPEEEVNVHIKED